jgi:hypothetical protein
MPMTKITASTITIKRTMPIMGNLRKEWQINETVAHAKTGRNLWRD